ncbi:U4/U6.U5 tri-snRNP-associated protein 1-like [Palaemon carinicauda]|uniref:U4/U6.U5 tri-snRNP-associated protein 1-like n=1 Tax=Palaemon carinicauda TaxID=392227 RepID=UPI0035B5C268
MGSSSKKKDKDREKSKEDRREKKRKRRSRSGSREKDRENRHHHRHHHKHKKQRSKKREDRSRSRSPSHSEDSLSEVEELLQIKDDPSYQLSQSSKLGKQSPSPPPSHLLQPVGSDFASSGPVGGEKEGGAEASLSIEETNKIRAKLGLKPLKIDNAPKNEEESGEVNDGDEVMEDVEGGKKVTVAGEQFVHKPAENLAQKLQVEKLREKIAAQREKRRIKEKLKKVKTLAESDSEEESAKAWVNKSRKLSKERALAEQKSKMLEELDAQFGIGALLEQDMTEEKIKKYSRKELSGLRVEHDLSRFDEGRTTILTLKDSNILANEEDTLVNVNIIDDERVEKNLKRRKMKLDEVEYEAPEMDEFGHFVQNNLLTKYDEEIVGEKKKSFRLGHGGEAYALNEESGSPAIPDSVRRMSKLRKLQSLEAPQSQLASEYLTPTEMVSFRKVKKPKKSKKKKFNVDDLKPLEEESLADLGSYGARQARIESLMVENDIPAPSSIEAPQSGPRMHSLRELLEEEEEAEESVKMEVDTPMDVDDAESEMDDIELQEALARSRRAKLAHSLQPSSEKISEMLRSQRAEAKEEEEDDDEEEKMDESTGALMMTLNTTDEFCRTLGDIPTYGLSGNRAEEEQTMLQLQQPKEKEQQEHRGAWEEVGIDDTRVEISDNMTTPILEEEPDASKGVANALKLALKKGYLEKNNISKSANAALQHLRAIHYSIEDKAVDDERGRGRGERYMGPVTEFKDKDGYKPDVKLEYVDDDGRKLNAKEAFRYLSHKFHGKGSGKNKTEKRMKKYNEELLMKHMSSSDTPLQTLERQREKQKQLGAAYLILSGSKTQESMDVKK